MRRVAGLILVLCSAEGCSPDATGGGVVPDDAGSSSDTADVVHAPDTSKPDGAIDVSIEPRDVTGPADPADAAIEPSLDVDTQPDGRAGDATSRDGTPEGGSADVTRPADATTDRCRAGTLRANVWTSVETFQTDASSDADADRADARIDGADGVSTRDSAADGVDGDADASFDAQCRALKDEWRRFVEQNSDCSTGADCMLVIGARACDCGLIGNLGQGIARGGGEGVAVTAREQAQSHIDRWRTTGCEFWRGECVSDARPSTTVNCTQGKCTADFPSCIQPPPEPCY